MSSQSFDITEQKNWGRKKKTRRKKGKANKTQETLVEFQSGKMWNKLAMLRHLL